MNTRAAVEASLICQYKKGLADGVEEALDQLLGEAEAQGAVPEINEATREWAKAKRATVIRMREEARS